MTKQNTTNLCSSQHAAMSPICSYTTRERTKDCAATSPICSYTRRERTKGCAATQLAVQLNGLRKDPITDSPVNQRHTSVTSEVGA